MGYYIWDFSYFLHHCHLCIFTLQSHISPRTSLKSRAWSPIWNSIGPWSASTRCNVMTDEAIKCSEVDILGSWMDRPACLTGRRVTPLTGVLSTAPQKRAENKDHWIASSTGEINYWRLRWCTGQNPTPFGGNFSDQSMLSVGICMPPRP